jgi:biotin transporter BioY
MEIVATIIGSITGIVGLVCWILVLIKMFQAGQTGLAIVSIVTFCCVIGYLIPFIYGWMKAKEWSITNIMVVWSICIVINLITGAISPPKINVQQFQTQQIK